VTSASSSRLEGRAAPGGVASEDWPPGFRLHHVDTIGSTNDEAARLALSGAPTGTVVLADEQTRGRGRLGRSWQSMPGNLHSSILLRPDCPLKAASQLSLLAAVALADTLATNAPADRSVTLKWPNDVLIDGAKVAGILLESSADKGGRLAYVVIGVGINVAFAPEAVPYPVATLSKAGFPSQSPHAWLRAFLCTLGIWLDRWQRDGFGEVREAWQARSYGRGGPIRLRLNQEEVEGRFIGLTDVGALVIERADGTRSELTAGDVLFADH